MSTRGFTGISFPFRVGVRGGVVTSTTSVTNISHILESMEQILRTRPLERCMEYHVKSDVDSHIFDPNDGSLKSLLAYEVEQALSIDDRISVKSVEVNQSGSELYATVSFVVLAYDTLYTEQVKVGDTNNVQNSN